MVLCHAGVVHRRDFFFDGSDSELVVKLWAKDGHDRRYLYVGTEFAIWSGADCRGWL